MAERVGSQAQGQDAMNVTGVTTAKRRHKRSSVMATSPGGGVMPPADADSARRHMIAYFYAAYSGCNCDACKALRPIAQKIIKSMEGGEG